MRVLVTGRGGQVAKSLEERAPAGMELLVVGRPEFDLTDSDSIGRVVAEFAPTLVISTAAYTAVDKAEDEPDLAMTVNGTGPAVLAAAARQVGASIIHLSTDYVFDGALDRPYREADPVGPLGVYGKTKLAGEDVIRASGAHYAIVRTAWVYSPFGQNFVKTMLRLAADRDTLSVVEDQVGCPTSALDIADALFAIASTWAAKKRGEVTSGVYHFAGSGSVSWADFAREIFAISGARGGPTAAVVGIASADRPTKAQRPMNSRLDCDAIAHDFGVKSTTWQNALREVVTRLV